MKTKLKEYKVRHDFPFVETCGVGTFLFLLCFSVYHYVNTKETEWLLLIIGVLLGLYLSYWITNLRNKTITFSKDVAIRPWLSFTPIILKLEEIQGYRLKETYTRWGLDYHVQILTKSDRKFEFIKDVYPEYGKLKIYLDNYGIKYLGKKQIEWKFKHIYSRVGVYASVIAAVLFVLVQLMKLLK